MKIEFDLPEETWLELSGNLSEDADASGSPMNDVYTGMSKRIDHALRASGYFEQEEPPIEEHDPGPEVDDEGGMSEYRHGIDLEEPEDRYVPGTEWTPGWPPSSSEDM